MKRILCILLLLFGCSLQADAQINGAAHTTDIHAFIDHFMVPSYNVDGYTSVIVRDLENYGFTVLWDEATKTVSFYRDFAKPQTPMLPVYDTRPVGEKIFDVYQTDIRTFFRGVEIPSYNIGGKTVVRFRDIAIVGSATFDEEKRFANVYCRDAEYFEDELSYIKETFYGKLLLLAEADKKVEPLLYMLQSGEYDASVVAEYKAFYDDFCQRMEAYKEFKEPYGFSESAQELWWAMVNTRFAGETALIMADHLYQGKSNQEAMGYYNQYANDSLTQRNLALAMLDAEMQALTLFWG